MLTPGKATKRFLIGLPLALLALFLLWVLFGPVAVFHSEAGRWRPSNEVGVYAELESKEFKIFERIAEQQPHEITKLQNLRFMFTWPVRKWITFAQRRDGGAGVVVAESILGPNGYEQDKLEVRTFDLNSVEYKGFLAAFDGAAEGYRFQFGYACCDGRSFTYERWRNGQATHYSGNADFQSKDRAVLNSVVAIVRRHGGFAQDRY